MTAKETYFFDFDNYHPQSQAEVQFVPSELPKPVFKLWQTTKYKPKLFSTGLIVINIIHRNFPRALCQVQMVLEGDQYRVWRYHASPTGVYIPDELVKKIAHNEIMPKILDKLDKLFNQSPLQ